MFQDVFVHEIKWPLVSLINMKATFFGVQLIDSQHLLRRQKCADWGYKSTGKIAKKLRKFLQDCRLGFGELLQRPQV